MPGLGQGFQFPVSNIPASRNLTSALTRIQLIKIISYRGNVFSDLLAGKRLLFLRLIPYFESTGIPAGIAIMNPVEDLIG